VRGVEETCRSFGRMYSVATLTSMGDRFEPDSEG